MTKKKVQKSKATTKSKSKKTVPKTPEAPIWTLFGVAVGSMFLSYGFASWAIDSGSLWHYLATFISVYYAFTYLQKFIKSIMRKHDKATKA